MSPKQKSERNLRQKRLILDKSSSLFYRKGYRSTSMRDIASACRFEPANIYYYFSSKEQILYEVYKEAGERLVAAIAGLEHDSVRNPEQRLRSLISLHFQTPVPGGKPYYLMFDTELKSLSPAHRQRIIELRDIYDRILRRIIQDGVDDGTFAPTDVKLSGYAIASVVVRSRLWFSPKGRLSGEEVCEFICDFALNALKKPADQGQIRLM